MKLVPIKLDKDRVLKFGVRAFVEIERVLDTSLDKVDFNRQESIYALLYAGLIHMDRKLTLDKVYTIVENMIDKVAEEENLPFMEAYGKVLAEIGEKIGEAMGNASTPNGD